MKWTKTQTSEVRLRDATIKKFEAVKQRIKNGELLKEALAAEKLSPAYYYKNKRKAALKIAKPKKSKSPEFIDVVHREPGLDYVIICPIAQAQAVLMGLRK